MRALIEVGEPLVGVAEAIPLADACVDAVFVGEAFQWFDASEAVAEIARVLVPRGGLAVIWTHWWETEPPLSDTALELLSGPYQRSLSPSSSNLRIAAALAERGYDFRLVLGDGEHSLAPGRNHGAVILPDALRWLWRP